jgi:hypothetical protein
VINLDIGINTLSITLFLILLGIALFCEFDPFEVFALSPSFTRQIITDPINDWFLVKDINNFTTLKTSSGTTFQLNIAKNITDCLPTKNSSKIPDISTVTFYSDGRNLNATLWLSSVFEEPPINATVILNSSHINIPWYKIRYGITINTPSIYDANGSDYQSRILWDFNNKKWVKTIDELVPRGSSRSLNLTQNYLNFFQPGKAFIDIPLELSTLHYPNQYVIFFYISNIFVRDSYLCRLNDITDKVHIPPPEFNLTTSKNSLQLRPWETQNTELQIKSNTKIYSQFHLSTNEPEGINVKLVPNQTAIPAQGISATQIKITALDNATEGSYTVPIISKISFPLKVQFQGISQDIPNSNSSVSIFQNTTLAVNILKPLSISEHLNDFYTMYVVPIGGIWSFIVGVIAIISPLILNKKRKSRRRQRENKDK